MQAARELADFFASTLRRLGPGRFGSACGAEGGLMADVGT